MRARILAARAAYFAAGFRAVFERDFLVLTSAGRFVALRTAVLLVLLGVTATILARLTGATGRPASKPDEIGRALFTGFAVAYPLLVCLLGPALAAGSLAAERSLDTLPLVLASPIRPASLVLAKFLSRLGALLVPLVGGLPIAATAFLYGGISRTLFVEWVLVVAALACLAVASSVVASAYSRNVAGAILGAYALAVVVPLADWAVSAGVASHLRQIAPPWAWTHSAGVTVHTIVQASAGRGVTTGGVGAFVGTAAAATLAALLLSTGRLAREQAVAAGTPPGGRVRRPLFANPVVDRACLALPLRARGFAPWTAPVVIAAVSVPVPFLWPGDEAGPLLAALTLCTAGAVVVVLARASQSVALERQQGSLAVLLSTRLTATDVLAGKLMGLGVQAALLLVPGLLLALAAAAGWVPGVRDFPVLAIAAWLAASATVVLLAAALGLWTSARAATAGKAAGLTFGLAVTASLAPPLLLVVALLADLDSLGAPFAWASPLAQVFGLVQGTLGADGRDLAWVAFWLVADVVGALLLLDDARSRVEEGE